MILRGLHIALQGVHLMRQLIVLVCGQCQIFHDRTATVSEEVPLSPSGVSLGSIRQCYVHEIAAMRALRKSLKTARDAFALLSSNSYHYSYEKQYNVAIMILMTAVYLILVTILIMFVIVADIVILVFITAISIATTICYFNTIIVTMILSIIVFSLQVCQPTRRVGRSSWSLCSFGFRCVSSFAATQFQRGWASEWHPHYSSAEVLGTPALPHSTYRFERAPSIERSTFQKQV